MKEDREDGRKTWRKRKRDEQVVRGVRVGEPCALCPHDWGQHAYNPPHNCCLCKCRRFTVNAQEGEA